MQLNLTSPPYRHLPVGPNPRRFESSDHHHIQGISQLEPSDDIFRYPETPQEKADGLFHPTQWYLRQAPMYQGVQNHSTYPFEETSSVEDPAMRPALAYNGVSFSEDLANFNDRYASNPTGPRGTMEYPDETCRTVNQVRRENIAFPAPLLPRPAAYNAHLTPEVSPNNGFGVDPTFLGADSIHFPSARQGNFRNLASSPPDLRGASYTNTMNGLAHQIYAEDVHSPTPLVQPPAVSIPYNYGESVSNENGTGPELVQWLKPFHKSNPAQNGYPYPPEGYDDDANSLQGIGSSPETNLTSLSPTPSSEASNPRRLTAGNYEIGLSRSTPSRGLQTQSGLHRLAPYPATSQAKEEPQLKNSKKINPISLLEAEALFGPKIREHWGTTKNIPNSLLWETRSTVEGGGSLKKRSKCKICGSLCDGSAALYHARRHLNIKPYPCEHNDCPDSFAQSSDRRNHMEKIHQKYLDRPSTPPTSSQDHLNNLYHG